MDRSTNVHTGVRMAVLDKACSKALVFELSNPSSSSLGSTLMPVPLDDSSARGEPSLVASEMSLGNTLLASAVAMRKARFVRDTTNYLQSTAHPARDIFTQPAQLVASLVVVPLVHGDEAPRAALYLTLESPNDFSNLQAPLLGFINSVIPLLHLKLEAHQDEIWSEAQAIRSHSTKLAAMRRQSRVDLLASAAAASGQNSPMSSMCGAGRAAAGLMVLGSDPSDDGRPGGAGARLSNGGYADAGSVAPAAGGTHTTNESDDDAAYETAGGAPSSHLSTVNSKRLCTEAMVKVSRSGPGVGRLSKQKSGLVCRVEIPKA